MESISTEKIAWRLGITAEEASIATYKLFNAIRRTTRSTEEILKNFKPKRRNKMAYNYEKIKPSLFIEAHQRLFLEIRDKVHSFLRETGVAKMGFVLNGLSGDAWLMMACVDRLVELDEIKEVIRGDCRGQDRIFVKKEKQ